MKTYLGDSVYAEWDGEHVVLTVENGTDWISETIYLNTQVISALADFIEKQTGGEKDASE
jgi:hypothetical protein